MKNFSIKQLFLIPVTAAALLLQGCAVGDAGGKSYLHGYKYCNIGKKSLSYIKIEYGEIRPTEGKFIKKLEGGDNNCLNGRGITAQIPIPETIQVEWETTDAIRRSMTIPIRSLVTTKHPVSDFQIRFNDNNIEIIQVYIDGLQPFKNAKTIIFEK